MALSQPTTLRLPPELEARLRKLADRSGSTVSELVRQMTTSGLGKLEAEAASIESKD